MTFIYIDIYIVFSKNNFSVIVITFIFKFVFFNFILIYLYIYINSMFNIVIMV